MSVDPKSLPHHDMTGLQITSQSEDHQPGPDGRFVAGVRVHFQTRHGDTGSVFIPRHEYTAEAVRQKLHAYVQQMHLARGITGTSAGLETTAPGTRHPG